MGEFIATVGSKISTQVTLVNEIEYTDYKFNYYGTTHYIYIMKDANGNVLVWKTSTTLVFDDGENMDCIRKGDTMTIRGTVKEHSEYKGVKQTVLTRCKFELVAHKPDDTAIKSEKQLQSIKDGDFVWEMPYRQFKEHYSDCETVCGSFDQDNRTIKVIIRDGRLKNNGVRGKHFSGYKFMSNDGKYVCYRAVSEETARKQLAKQFSNSDAWDCVQIYSY